MWKGRAQADLAKNADLSKKPNIPELR